MVLLNHLFEFKMAVEHTEVIHNKGLLNKILSD